jgi:hypothetical protein
MWIHHCLRNCIVTVPNNHFFLSAAFMAQVINSLRSLRKREKKRIFVDGKTKSREENSERIEVANCRRKFGILCLLVLPGNSKIKCNIASLMLDISIFFNWQKASRKRKLKKNFIYIRLKQSSLVCRSIRRSRVEALKWTKKAWKMTIYLRHTFEVSWRSEIFSPLG